MLVNGPARYIADNPVPFDADLHKAFKAAAEQADGTWIVDARPIVAAHMPKWQAIRPRLPDGTPADWPVRFNDQIDLIGFKVDTAQTTAGTELGLTTYWRVSGPIDPCAPLAMFVHVANDQSGIVGQYDGWNTALRGLEAGDVIVQHVRIPINPDAPAGRYVLQAGLYSPDSMQRWIARTPAGQHTDRIILSPIEITAP